MIYAVQLWQEGRPTAVAHRPIIRFQPQTANTPTNKQHNTTPPCHLLLREVGNKLEKWLGGLSAVIEADLKEITHHNLEALLLNVSSFCEANGDINADISW